MNDQKDRFSKRERQSYSNNQNKEKYAKYQNDQINNEVLDYYSDIRTNNEKENSKKNSIKEPKIVDEININQFNDDENLTQSLKDILLDKEFASPIVVKKENKLITDYHYVTFQNSYGENTCYVNVILHLLYNIPELEEYLVSLYQIDSSNDEKDNYKNGNKNINIFFVLLGKILYDYRNIISQENDIDEKKVKKNTKKNQVTIIKTLNMRKILENISYNKFPLNTIADPVELFTFILEILNDYLKEDLHKSFYLELIDEFSCNSKNKCQINIKNKYDKDNFIYHIYIDEILKFIEQDNLKVKTYKSKLFEYSYKLFLSENKKQCEKCKEEMIHNLVCMNYPDFLLINCVWKESNPIVDDVISFFFLMSLKDDLNNLFVCNQINQKTRKRYPYYLLGFILYSFTLSHYIICVYNYDERVFILFDDEIVKEYNNLYDLLIDITVNVLKVNGKAFFYPVMLIYTKENIFNNNIIKLNTLNDSEYQGIINKCNQAIYEYQLQNNMLEEEKMINFQDYIEKQKEIENSIKKTERRKNRYKKNEKENNEEEINKLNNYHETELNNKGNNKNDTNYKKNSEVSSIEINDKGMNEETPDINKYNEKEINNQHNTKRYREKEKNRYFINKDNEENKEEEDIKMKEVESNSNSLKKGLNIRNSNKMSQILEDLKKVRGNESKNDLYIGNFRDLDILHKKNINKDNMENQGNELNNENTEIKSNIFNNRRKNNIYMSSRYYNEKEKKRENNEIDKKRNNIEEKNHYSLRNNYQNNSNNQEKFIVINKPNINNNNNEDNIENINGMGSKRRRGKDVYKSNIIIKNNKKDNNFEENENNDEKAYKNKYNDNENVYTKTKNISKTNYKTPKKELIRSNLYKSHNEDTYSNNNILFNNNSEKKSNIFKSQFIGKKIINSGFKDNQNIDEDKNTKYSIKDNNESNDNKKRSKYYFRNKNQ